MRDVSFRWATRLVGAGIIWNSGLLFSRTAWKEASESGNRKIRFHRYEKANSLCVVPCEEEGKWETAFSRSRSPVPRPFAPFAHGIGYRLWASRMTPFNYSWPERCSLRVTIRTFAKCFAECLNRKTITTCVPRPRTGDRHRIGPSVSTRPNYPRLIDASDERLRGRPRTEKTNAESADNSVHATCGFKQSTGHHQC
jgi:hypothetical protein